MKNKKVSICDYCGEVYFEGISLHEPEALIDHIKVCKKYQMKEEKIKIVKLTGALVGLIGVSTKSQLKELKIKLFNSLLPEKNKVASVNAISVLLEVMYPE